MPRSNLCKAKEEIIANRIIKNLPQQKVVAEKLGITQQAESYRESEVYPRMLKEAIMLIGLAGYEVKERDW